MANWIEDYKNIMHDPTVPPEFIEWTAISIIAGALERKCWMPSGIRKVLYPNLYIVFIAKPGVGKTQSIDPGINDILIPSCQNIKLFPQQLSEARLWELLGDPDFGYQKRFEFNGVHTLQTGGYYINSEGSNALKRTADRS